jgi:DNA-binding transcriptional ArsR family regulator
MISEERDGENGVFKALADPTRRKILDLLRDRPSTTGELCDGFPDLSRFAVMKHLGVLEGAGLVVVRREGRVRWNHLNAVPIQRIHDRWMNRFAAPLAASLLRLEEQVLKESKPKPKPKPKGNKP